MCIRDRGNQQATSVTLNTSGYNGSYYVLMGFSNNNSRSFTGSIYSLKCNFYEVHRMLKVPLNNGNEYELYQGYMERERQRKERMQNR